MQGKHTGSHTWFLVLRRPPFIPTGPDHFYLMINTLPTRRSVLVRDLVASSLPPFLPPNRTQLLPITHLEQVGEVKVLCAQSKGGIPFVT